MKFAAILFDAIGTTIMESRPDIVNRSFENAFATCGLAIDPALIIANRGRNKKEAIQTILTSLSESPTKADIIYTDFTKNLRRNLHHFHEAKDLRPVVSQLKTRGLIVGVGTGLDAPIFNEIFQQLRWQEITWDFIGTAADVQHGRPDPEMIFMMMKKFNVTPSSFLKVGDTVSDILEGVNAGVPTCAVLSGTVPKEELLRANPHYVVQSLGEIVDIVAHDKKN